MKTSKKYLFAVAMAALFMWNTEEANCSSTPITDIGGHCWKERKIVNCVLYRPTEGEFDPSAILDESKSSLYLNCCDAILKAVPFNAMIPTIQYVKDHSITLTEVHIDGVALTQEEFDALCGNIETNPNLKVVKLLDIPINETALTQLAKAMAERSKRLYPALEVVDISNRIEYDELSYKTICSFLETFPKSLNVKGRLASRAMFGELFRASQERNCAFINDGFEIDDTNPSKPKFRIQYCNSGYDFGVGLGNIDAIDVEMNDPSLEFMKDFGKGLEESLRKCNRECSGVSLTLSKRSRLEQEFIDCLGILPIAALNIVCMSYNSNLNWSIFLANQYWGKLYIQGRLNDNFYNTLGSTVSNLETIVIEDNACQRKIPAAWVINLFAIHPNLAELSITGIANMGVAEKKIIRSWQANPSDEVAIRVGVLHIGNESF